MTQFNLSTLFLLTILIAVLVAVSGAVPGLGVLFTLLSVAPLVRTNLVLQKRRLLFPQEQHGVDVKAMLFITSLFVSIFALGMTIFCSLGCACATGLIVVSIFGSIDLAVLFAVMLSMIAGTGVAVLLISAFTKWSRYRWERDTHWPTLFSRRDLIPKSKISNITSQQQKTERINR